MNLDIPQLDEWKRQIHTRPYTPPPHSHTHAHTHTHTQACTHTHMKALTHTYTRTRAHTHTHTHTYTQDAASHILVSGISPEGTVDRHSGVSPHDVNAQVHVTNFMNWCVAGEAIQFVSSHKTSLLQILVEPRTRYSKRKFCRFSSYVKKYKPRSGWIYQNRNVDGKWYRK